MWAFALINFHGLQMLGNWKYSCFLMHGIMRCHLGDGLGWNSILKTRKQEKGADILDSRK